MLCVARGRRSCRHYPLTGQQKPIVHQEVKNHPCSLHMHIWTSNMTLKRLEVELFFFGPLRHLTCVCQQQRWIQVLGESCLLQTSFHQSRRRKQITTKLCQCGVVNAIYATEGTSYLLSSLSFRKKKLLPWHPYLILKPNKYGHCVG